MSRSDGFATLMMVLEGIRVLFNRFGKSLSITSLMGDVDCPRFGTARCLKRGILYGTAGSRVKELLR